MKNYLTKHHNDNRDLKLQYEHVENKIQIQYWIYIYENMN